MGEQDSEVQEQDVVTNLQMELDAAQDEAERKGHMAEKYKRLVREKDEELCAQSQVPAQPLRGVPVPAAFFCFPPPHRR